MRKKQSAGDAGDGAAKRKKAPTRKAPARKAGKKATTKAEKKPAPKKPARRKAQEAQQRLPVDLVEVAPPEREPIEGLEAIEGTEVSIRVGAVEPTGREEDIWLVAI